MHQSSADDRRFRSDFESGRIRPESFDHRAHIRLAYTYLVENDPDGALTLMRSALGGFIARNGIPASKYHETLTRAWILAVRHFMANGPATPSADAFIASNPRMLDGKIMMTHYSAAALFSPEARESFVEPDLQQIPRHGA